MGAVTAAPATPAPARVLIAAVCAGGAAAVALQLRRVPAMTGRDLLALALVAAAVVLADRFTLEIPHGEDSETFMLADSVWTAALLLATPGVPTLGAVAGTAASQLAGRWPLRKVAFNVGQVALALLLAESVVALGPALDPLDARAWALAAVAIAAAAVVNIGLVALVIALVQREPSVRVLLGPWRVNLGQWVGNASLGLLAAVLWQVSPYGLVLLAVPLVLLALAYRQWVRDAIEADQMGRLMRGAEVIAREQAFAARLPVAEGGGRLPELTTALNHMLDRLELALHRQRQLMLDVAARLRRPVAALAAAAEPAGRGLRHNGSAVPHQDTAPALEQDLALVRRVLDDLEDLGRSRLPGYVTPQPVQVADVVAGIAAKAQPILADRLHATSPDPGPVVDLDRDRMEEALLRLLTNTAQHGSGARPVTLRAVEEDRAVLFEVVDEGGGVPAGHEDAIFEPFYSAGGRREGAGLGLALVRTVAEAHGGSAGVVNRPGAGVTFWVRVPR